MLRELIWKADSYVILSTLHYTLGGQNTLTENYTHFITHSTQTQAGQQKCRLTWTQAKNSSIVENGTITTKLNINILTSTHTQHYGVNYYTHNITEAHNSPCMLQYSPIYFVKWVRSNQMCFLKHLCATLWITLIRTYDKSNGRR